MGNQRRRYSYWQHIFSKSDFQETSVAELAANDTVLSLEDSNLVIVNWDCANGDSAYGSDYTLGYFETQGSTRVHELLKDRGTLLCECQTVKGVPVPASYGAMFGIGEVQVLTDVLEEAERRGDTATIVERFSTHPVLRGISTIHSQYQDLGETMFGCSWTGSEQSKQPIMKRFPRSVWFGWFTTWKRGWVPLLEAQLPSSYSAKTWFRTPAAVLLAKYHRGGLLLASTMWLGAARCEELIRNVVEVDMDDVRREHRKAGRRRLYSDVLFLFVIFSFAVYCLAGYINLLRFPWFRKMISVSGIGLFALFALLWRTYKSAWRRPYGFSPWLWLAVRIVQVGRSVGRAH